MYMGSKQGFIQRESFGGGGGGGSSRKWVWLYILFYTTVPNFGGEAPPPPPPPPDETLASIKFAETLRIFTYDKRKKVAKESITEVQRFQLSRKCLKKKRNGFQMNTICTTCYDHRVLLENKKIRINTSGYTAMQASKANTSSVVTLRQKSGRTKRKGSRFHKLKNCTNNLTAFDRIGTFSVARSAGVDKV